MAPSIAAEPEELLRAGEGIGVRTGRAGNISKRAGDAGRGLQIETGVCPAQHQFVVQLLKSKASGWNWEATDTGSAQGLRRTAAMTITQRSNILRAEPERRPRFEAAATPLLSHRSESTPSAGCRRTARRPAARPS